jgi:lantibiotic biosynthesis protein
VLGVAAPGATPDDLAATVPTDAAERAHRYVDDLIEQQVLVPKLDLQMTGADSTYGLAAAVPVLAEVREELGALDAEALGVSPERYRRIAARLESLPAKLDLDRLFQVDMTKRSPEATLGRDVVDEILRGAELLRRIGSAAEGTAMKAFVERFQERYEQRAVPLLEALDPDLGVSFDRDGPAQSPLLAGLDARDDQPAPASWSPREEHLLSRLLEVHESGSDELILRPVDLEKLARKNPPPLPDAFAVMAVVAAASENDLARGRFRVLVSGADGPSGARLLGRFCHADPGLHAAVDEHLRAEEALDPEAIFAEIVHLPRARDVNVVARPVLRGYELACLGTSGAPPQKQLQLEDLLVSVEDGHVVLRSRRLGRRVVPRMTTAHNFGQRGVAVYRFLCHVQAQGTSGGAGFWGPLADAPRLPRVRSGRVILERARWRLDRGDLDRRADRDADFRALQEWRRLRRVPRFVSVLGDGLELPTDLDNVLAGESLVQVVRSRGSARVIEMFPNPQELCVQGPEGRFVHELVVPFVRMRASVLPEARPPASTSIRRTFTPGSDWLYARIYTGETVADRVLTDDVAVLVRELVGSGAADHWFFLRYRDAAFHLRVRFHGDPDRLHAECLPALQALGADLVERGSAWRLELGTYEREVERYGGPHAIELVERAFHADSDAVLAILPLLESGDEGQEERWRLGLCGSHRLLVDLGFGRDQRLALARESAEAIARRLGWDKTVRGRVGKRFRRERRILERLLDPDPEAPTGLEPGLEILNMRSQVLEPIGAELERLDSNERLNCSRSSIAGSLLHMHLNRLLRGDNTAQEAVIWDFLARLYEAESRRMTQKRR